MADNVQRPNKGLYLDSSPKDQPESTYRYALNAVNATGVGDMNFLSTEKGNLPSVDFPEGFVPLGHVYTTDDSFIVFLVNPETKFSQIGLIDKAHRYTTVVNTPRLGFTIGHQIDATFRIRRGSEWVVYWTDNNVNPMSFNFGRQRDYWSYEYTTWFDSHNGDDTGFVGDKWDGSKFKLIQEYSQIPIFRSVEVKPSGNLDSGSYSFGIFYVDENTNSSECINTCEPVNIYADDTTKIFETIRGSNNSQEVYESFPKCNKSIHVTMDNLDKNFQFYRIAIIKATSGTGSVNEVLLSNLISTENNTFVYYGQDTQFQRIALEDIVTFANRVERAGSIEQLENRLILANIQNKVVDWLDFQKYASRITSRLVTRRVVLNRIADRFNPKNPVGPHNGVGYMPGEVYSFGIVYVFKDGSVSPVFHIPGNSEGYGGLSNGMGLYRCLSVYPAIHKNDIQDFWGNDFLDRPLEGTPIRHHKFPFRDEADLPLVEKNEQGEQFLVYLLDMTIRLKPNKTFPEGTSNIPYTVGYRKQGASTSEYQDKVLTEFDLGSQIRIYSSGNDPDDSQLEQAWADGDFIATNYGAINPTELDPETFDVSFTYAASGDVLQSVYSTDIMGIEFGNVQLPHPDIIGYYIVRNESVESDRLVVDNAIMNGISHNPTKPGDDGERVDADIYHSFGMWNFKPKGSAYKLKDWAYIFSLEHQFTGTLISFENIRRASKFEMDAGSTRFGTKYVNDVYPGTSYNAEAHDRKSRDEDGFDLALRYRDNNCVYSYDPASIATVNMKPQDLYYLSAGAYTQVEEQIIYNTSCDNKMCVVKLEDEFDELADINVIQYVNLTNNVVDAYADFMSRTYYKEHDNLIYIADGWSRTYNYQKDDLVLYGDYIYIAIKENTGSVPSPLNDDWSVVQDNTSASLRHVFHGDAYVSPINPVSSMMYDIKAAYRKDKKKSWWEYVVGAISIVGGLVLTLTGVGAVAGIGLIALGIGFIAAGVMSGMRLEALQEMVEIHYKTGLRETVEDVDSGTFECDYVDGLDNRPNGCTHAVDDTILWFHDRLSNIFIESRLNISLRNGYTIGSSDFVNAPGNAGGDTTASKPTGQQTQGTGAEFMTYLMNKMTALDREHADGRSYLGFPVAEIYALNLDYMRFNKEKLFYHLPVEYSVNRENPEHFTHRVMYSEQSYQEELMDNYKIFLPNNYKDIEGEFGEITDLLRKDNRLYIFTRESFWYLPQNLQQQIIGDLITVIGTGEFFSINPQRILDEKTGGGGTSDKWATVLNRYGIFYASEIEGKVYLFTDSLKEISLQGLDIWLKNNLHLEFNKQWFEHFGENYPFMSNPANNIGLLSVYDTTLDRYLLTKRDYHYLGDWSEVIKDVDTSKDYPNGTIIIGEDGEFEEIIGIEYIDSGVLDFDGWATTEYMKLKLGLLEPSDYDHQLITQYGRIYQDGNDLIYTANNYDDINFNGQSEVRDVIDITLGPCGQEQVEFVISNIPSKACPNGFAAGATVAYQTTVIVLGRYSGVVKFLLGTYNVRDSFKIYYGGNPDGTGLLPQNLLFSTEDLPGAITEGGATGMIRTYDYTRNGGEGIELKDEFKWMQACSNEKDLARINIAIKFNYVVKDPNIQHVTLVTQAPLPRTLWEYFMGCPCTEWGGTPSDPKTPITNWNFCQDCSS